MATKKSKFQLNLEKSHKDIKGQRASMLSKDAERKLRRRVDQEEEKLEDLEMTLLNLQDLSPDSTTTLKVTKDGFDSESWAQQIVDSKVKLTLQEQKVKIARETYEEYFGE